MTTINDKFWEQFGDISEDKASINKVFPERGVGFIYGKPASRKTTIAIDTVKGMDFYKKFYIDCDSKSIGQAKETYTNLSKLGFGYRNSLLENVEPVKAVEQLLEEIKKLKDMKPRCVIIDTWHQLLAKENDNEIAKSIMKELRSYAQRYNLLITMIAHIGHQSDDIRGASAVSGDATFKVLVSQTDIKDEFAITITKDSLGLLSDSTAIITKVGSISASIIEYSSEIKEKRPMRAKEMALQVTIVNAITEILKEKEYITASEFREWMYDNVNKLNKFEPSHELFMSNRFVKDNFSDFINELLVIETEGRTKRIVGVKNEE